MIKVLEKYSYLILATLLVLFEGINISKGQWFDDFWEHSAAVYELSHHLLKPVNPIINENIPHAFFSPYTLLVGFFSRITNLNSIQSLEYFAYFNLLFFLLTFYFFIKSIFKTDYILISSLSLVLILLFWGEDPYSWSGFYHLFVFGSVLPYPSTFAMSLTFLTLSFITKNQFQKKYMNMIIVTIILSSVILIIHPTTALFLFIAIIAFTFSANNDSLPSKIAFSSLVIASSIVLALFWPYYNLIELGSTNIVDFHNDSERLYMNLFTKCWPILVIIPGLIYYRNNETIHFLSVTLILTILIYAGGYVFNIYSVSRLISNSMMIFHILTAYMLVLSVKEFKSFNKIYLTSLTITFMFSLYFNRYFIIHTINFLKPTNTEYYSKYNFLRRTIKSNDLILSDPTSNWLIPSFNGKVISSNHPLYWVYDINERRKALTTFFDLEKSDTTRQLIIQKYKPDYILINYAEFKFKKTTRQWLNGIGNIIYEKDQLVLIKLDE